MPSIHVLSLINKPKVTVASTGALYENGLVFGQSPWLVGGVAAAVGIGGYLLMKKPEKSGPSPSDYQSFSPEFAKELRRRTTTAGQRGQEDAEDAMRAAELKFLSSETARDMAERSKFREQLRVGPY